MKPAELAPRSNGEHLRYIAPRFFWAESGQDQSPHSPLPEWFRTIQFQAGRLAAAFPGFADLVDKKGPLTGFVFDLITPRSFETASFHPAQALTEAEIILTTAHGWAARKEVMGVLPYLIILFSKHRVVGINPTLPGFGPSGFKESVPRNWRTPKGIDAVLLQAFSAMGIE